jgi:hypothetical protein
VWLLPSQRPCHFSGLSPGRRTAGKDKRERTTDGPMRLEAPTWFAGNCRRRFLACPPVHDSKLCMPRIEPTSGGARQDESHVIHNENASGRPRRPAARARIRCSKRGSD